MNAGVNSAAERNKAAILAVLERVLPRSGLVLEVASGTGQHVVHFAAALPALMWQPTDPDPQARRSIAAWIAGAKLSNVREPLDLNVCAQPWPIDASDALLCINMVHISPWTATEGLFEGAGRVLTVGGLIYLYGPYRVNGSHTAASNAAFDAALRAQDPRWGVRDLEAVTGAAHRHGFHLVETIAMPANNLSVILHKRSGG